MAKTLKIVKDSNEYKPGKFSQFSEKGFKLAAQKLNKTGLLLWLYLCENRDGYSWTLSPTAIVNELGVTSDVAKNMTKATGGIKELENAGFIVGDTFYAEGCPEADKSSAQEVTNPNPIPPTPNPAAFNF